MCSSILPKQLMKNIHQGCILSPLFLLSLPTTLEGRNHIHQGCLRSSKNVLSIHPKQHRNHIAGDIPAAAPLETTATCSPEHI